MREKLDFANSIKFALDESLKRLQTDYLDVYHSLARAQNELFWATRLHGTRGCGKITFTLSWKLWMVL
jgi:predicted aldo/keto reductase-like oxidoreductase